jgi:FecR protein
MPSRRKISPTFLSLLLLALLALLSVQARAADDDYTDEYDETARVVRVSLLRGDVSLRRDGSNQWEQAKLNVPLVEGDQLATGRDARVEIQIDARNFLRVDENSVLRIVTLRDEGIALSLSEGTATLRLARFDREREYFEVDAPRTTMAAEKQGVYRLDVEPGRGRVRLTVRDGGRARIYSDTSGFTLRDGRTAELVYDGAEAGDWELAAARTFDTWDSWVDERESYLASRLRYEERERYYDRDVWGAEELDAYGDWTYVNDYGWLWRPHVTVINNYYNWTPYRYGHWIWVQPYGWTWVGDEPWGWAPYHYGRWVYYNNNWCWAPRGYGYKPRRSWWRPALVAFVYIPTSYGEQVCWYPLGYGQRDPRGRHYRERQRLQPLRGNELARLERTNPAFLRAVTTQPARDFGQQRARLQPATADIARRAITTEPVRGRLPILPADESAGRVNGNGLEGRGRVFVPRPTATASGGPARASQERPTGAATRRPGTPLDDELRRTRLYNNREPRPAPSAEERARIGGNNTNGEEAGTGAVARPPRVRSIERQPSEREDRRRDDTGAETGAPPRPARPPRVNPSPRTTTTPAPDVDDSPGPRIRQDEPAPRPRPQPSSQPRDESPAPRPAPRYEPRPEPRPAPRSEPRDEPRPQPRPEPRQESRPEPRQESRPEPRQEAPRQESRPSREDKPSRPARRDDEPGRSRR